MNNEQILSKEFKDWTLSSILGVIIPIFITVFVCQLTVVAGSSMNPTLKNGDRLVIEKISTKFDKLKSGDVVVIDAKEELKKSGYDTSHSPLIKRVIGIEGDHIAIKDGYVYVNGIKKTENYVTNLLSSSENKVDIVVEKNHVFVMGDNRTSGGSLDSRVLGTLNVDKIKGVVLFRFYPLNEIGNLNK